ncbi:MAG TPA: AAA family ATPase [Thermoflexales bacterium]|nr:AAA family ATPase [Thermoflexales bacterium]
MTASAFDAIIGHAWAKRQLASAIAEGRLAQSHLFTGPTGVGKATLARALAAEALAGRAKDPARARSLALAGKHPDLSWLAPDEGSIKVETARELLHSLSLSPVEGGARVAVIDDAHEMTESAKNAILKTLEEPNPSVVIILIAPNVDGVLPTIASRCQILNLRPVPRVEIETALTRRGASPERAALLARLSRGRPGWAITALADEDALAVRAQRMRDLMFLLSASRTERLIYAEKLSRADAEEARMAALETWQSFWRDVARVSASGGAGSVRNSDVLSDIAGIAGRVDAATAYAAACGVREAMQRLQQNARPQLVLDAVMLTMPRLAAA